MYILIYIICYHINETRNIKKQAILVGLRTILTNRCCLGAILREIRSNFLVQRHKSFVVLPDFGIRTIRTLPGLALTERALAFTGLSEDFTFFRKFSIRSCASGKKTRMLRYLRCSMVKK